MTRAAGTLLHSARFHIAPTAPCTQTDVARTVLQLWHERRAEGACGPWWRLVVLLQPWPEPWAPVLHHSDIHWHWLGTVLYRTHTREWSATSIGSNDGTNYAIVLRGELCTDFVFRSLAAGFVWHVRRVPCLLYSRWSWELPRKIQFWPSFPLIIEGNLLEQSSHDPILSQCCRRHSPTQLTFYSISRLQWAKLVPDMRCLLYNIFCNSVLKAHVCCNAYIYIPHHYEAWLGRPVSSNLRETFLVFGHSVTSAASD